MSHPARLLGVAAGLACLLAWGGASPSVSPSATPTPAPVLPPEVAELDATACEATLKEKDREVAVYEADLGHGNRITLHLALPEPNDDEVPELVPAGFELLGWGELFVADIEKLLELDIPNEDLLDPGAICISSLSASGDPVPGRVFKDERYGHNLDLRLIGKLPPRTAAESVAAFASKEPASTRWVPFEDPPADGMPYISVRMGATSPHAHATALEAGNRLRGDVMVAIVDGRGQGVFKAVRAR